MTAPILQTEGLVKAYRGRRVVDKVSIRVGEGEIVGLLGFNIEYTFFFQLKLKL